MINILESVKKIQVGGLGAPIVLLMLLAMVVVPLPAFLLDVFFTFNIALSLVVLLTVMYVHRPLDFNLFPSMILIATLLRLALNVASTRIVLLEGHEGGDAAGKVIEAFGEFVIGGNYAVGLVVFFILVIINFVVVTKGAGRVAEVSARFTLDAMPGKQMAIDADLNSGLIDQDEARIRRKDVASEADFYGAMDGASKFVKGDAIAGILILIINIVGGLAIGMGQHDLAFSEAIRNYVLLTIGDGLAAQIPSLLLSTAAAIIVTRVAGSEDLGGQVSKQVLSNPKALAVTAGVLLLLGIIPGMPHIVFLSLGAAIAYVAYSTAQRLKADQGANPAVAQPHATSTSNAMTAPVGSPEAVQNEVKELSWDDVQPVDIIGLEVGYRLIPLVDKNQGGQLMNRIKGVRKKLSQDLGFLVQSVHIRDNLDLAPNAYRITLHGVPIGESEVFADRDMAINPGQVFGEVQGTPTTDPAFGLEALWIDANYKDQAQTMGYTVVDASTVVATHLSELLQRHAYELLGHEEVQQLLDNLSDIAPKLVEDLVPKLLPLSVVLRVLQNLLQESVSIRDIRTIAETLAEHATKSQDAGTLTSAVRVALSRHIVQQVIGSTTEIPVSVLDPGLERLLQQTLQNAGEDGAGIEPGLLENLQTSLATAAKEQELSGQESILLVAAGIRPWMSKFIRHSVQAMHVLSYNEIPDNRQIKVIATIGRDQQQG